MTPVVRYWPNVQTGIARDGVDVRTGDGTSLHHKPAEQGWF